jgi:hypothetical protein
MHRLFRSTLFVLGCLLLTASVQAQVTYDATANYAAGWSSGSNPNGVWSCGWSSTLLSQLNLYTNQDHVLRLPLGNHRFAFGVDGAQSLGPFQTGFSAVVTSSVPEAGSILILGIDLLGGAMLLRNHRRCC